MAGVLSKALKKAGHTISVVYGRDIQKAKQLAREVGAPHATDKPNFRPHDCEILMLCVRDEALGGLSSQILLPKRCLWCHLSGSSSMGVLKKHLPCGVFYPLQTFTEGIPTPLEDVPIYLEGSNEESLSTLAQLAASLRALPRTANEQQRLHLHLCAVMASNFPQYLWARCRKWMEQQSLPFEDLRLLAEHTLRKIFENSEKDTQTGPAARGDKAIVGKHLALLEKTDLQEAYRTLSRSIEQNRSAEG